MRDTVHRLVQALRGLPEMEGETFREGKEQFRAYSLDDLRVIIGKQGFVGLFFEAFGVEFYVTESFEVLFKEVTEDPAEDAPLLQATGELFQALESYLKMRTFFMRKFSL